jgi:hypothetical protein
LGVLLLLTAWDLHAAVPTFENQTPTGFSAQDSTDKQDFVEGQQITVRVDLNQAATPTYPVIGDFHNLETAEILESRNVDGLRADRGRIGWGHSAHRLDHSGGGVTGFDPRLQCSLCPQQRRR